MKHLKTLFVILLILILRELHAQPTSVIAKINTAKETFLKTTDNDTKVQSGFLISDNYMELDLYDSAQVWLNKIGDIYSIKQPTLFNYFLSSRQAEVYYYNNLLQLGLQSALQAVTIAEELTDSVLRADAYNLTGLMYLTMQQYAEAKTWFHAGFQYMKQPPYASGYLSTSYPHHLYGNIAEACEKLHQLDSATYYSYLSLKKAAEIGSPRGMAIAYNNLGNQHYKSGNLDSAVYHYTQSENMATQSKDVDVVLLNYAGLAQCANTQNKKNEAAQWLMKGNEIMGTHPEINDLFTKMFLQVAIQINKANNNEKGLVAIYEQLLLRDSVRAINNNTQVQNILKLQAANQNKVLKLEVTEARQKQQLATTRFLMALLCMVVLGISFLVYRNTARNKLQVAAIRNNISQDLHDEIGATLSGIALYSQLIKTQIQTQQENAVQLSLDRIQESAVEMVHKMSDIVWAVNPTQDSLGQLCQRIDDYAREMAITKNMQVQTNFTTAPAEMQLSMEVRRNLYLLLKEAVNNAIKYSNASALQLSIEKQGELFKCSVEDNGCGFEEQTTRKGNGFNNMRHRAAALSAHLDIFTKPGEGTTISFLLHLPQ